MTMVFTDKQKAVIAAADRDLLVSAAAGSGKTAVLVERIIRLITEGDDPVDIDRLLVVTFTRAAAAQMRERIGKAIADKLAADPLDRHLQRQETLLHTAQICTIDSFCTYILRNNFSEIGLDPGYRLMDETEGALLMSDVADAFMEEQYAAGDPDFIACVEFFSRDGSDERFEDLVRSVYTAACAHPEPERWLAEHESDYDVSSAGELMDSPWMRGTLRQARGTIRDLLPVYDRMLRLCAQPGGPYPYEESLRAERDALRLALDDDGGDEYTLLQRTCSLPAVRLPAISGSKYSDVDEDAKKAVQKLRDGVKKRIAGIRDKYFSVSLEEEAGRMHLMSAHVRTLMRLAAEFMRAFSEAKREKNIIDFTDLEHMALRILIRRDPDTGELAPTAVARAYRAAFAEIMIDEYQDSNEVQELLLRSISGEEDGRFNRFMVGDVKQSIYRFRLARQEIFMEKFRTYRTDDERRQRIDLDQNFRSRTQVLGVVNGIFRRIMREEIGGVPYDDASSLKPGAVFPDASCAPGAPADEDPYRTEFLLLETGREEEGGQGGAETDDPGTGPAEAAPEEELSAAAAEALMIARRIRELVGKLPVREGNDGAVRPARYGDIVVLLRADGGWNDVFRDVFSREQIPAYITARAGYFSTEEIREVMQLVRVLDNPLQDIPMYGVLHGYFGGFTEDEIARIRCCAPDRMLYEALERAAEGGEDVSAALSDAPALPGRCSALLTRIRGWRDRAYTEGISRLLRRIMTETGYPEFVAALPGGLQRSANLRMLTAQAAAFEKTQYTGLFQFCRYIDRIRATEVDQGEAGILDEKADVVRIMTIHKSKGLEFPICFVAALGRKFNLSGTGGDVTIDHDWGIGAQYFDAESRGLMPTARGSAIADKLRRESLGEELRILYVAMTRAEEKLILTGAAGNAQAAMDAAAMAAEDARGGGPLPVSVISGARSFMDLILPALSAEQAEPLHPAGGPSGTADTAAGPALPAIRCVPIQSLRVSDEVEESSRAARRMLLDGGLCPDARLESVLRERFSYRYPHSDLEGLYTKTTVTELKKAAMHGMMAGDEETAEDGLMLFAAPDPDVYVPDFAAPDGAEASGYTSGGRILTGAAYGTAVHRLMEILDIAALPPRSGGDAGAAENAVRTDVGEWIRSLAVRGDIPAAYAESVRPGPVEQFLRTSLYARMAAAFSRGQLFREQPFVLGVPASEIDRSFPSDETILVQGIIDAFFIEDGEAVILDYKTDRVRTGAELADRYRVQLDHYQRALEQAMGLHVRERYLYSFALGEVVPA